MPDEIDIREDYIAMLDDELLNILLKDHTTTPCKQASGSGCNWGTLAGTLPQYVTKALLSAMPW